MNHADDLLFAQTAGKPVKIVMINGYTIARAGVHDVDAEHNVFTLHRPETFGDKTTRERLLLGDVMSVTVLPGEWN